MKTLGLLGGMGPQASIDFYSKVIDLSQREFGAVRNSDFPHLLISNVPVFDLIEGTDSKSKTIEMLNEEAAALKSAGADFLAMACNTMHIFVDEIIDKIDIPFLSMIDSVVSRVQSKGCRKVGLLGTRTTVNSDLYLAPLTESGVEVLLPNDVAKLNDAILSIIAGEYGSDKHEALKSLISDFVGRGAEAVILGCTELPTVLSQEDFDIDLIFSLDVLAEDCCERIYS